MSRDANRPAPTTPPAEGTATPPPAADAVDHDPSRLTMLWKVGRVICRIYTSFFFDLKVYGAEHVPPTGGVLMVSNHQSYLDPVLVAVKLHRPMSYLAKSELFRNRFLNWLIRSLNAFPVRQGKGDVGAIKETIRRLHEGHLLNIYPEGSRTQTGELGPIEPGVGLVVRRANVPVVPAVIYGSFNAWPPHRKFPRSAPIRVMYGPPLQVEGLKGEQIVQLIDRTFREMLEKVRRMELEGKGRP